MTEFERRVDGVLRSLERGDVITYGEVASAAGYPGSGRAVGGFLARRGGDYAWWRVVMHDGRLAPGKEAEQAYRLRAEGVTVVGNRVRQGPPVGGRRALR